MKSTTMNLRIIYYNTRHQHTKVELLEVNINSCWTSKRSLCFW